MIEVAVVGVGGWGKNLARNYYQLPEANLRYICDLDDDKLEAMRRQYPAVSTTKSYDEVVKDPELDAVVIATTGPTHYSLAKQALEVNPNSFDAHNILAQIAILDGDYDGAEELVKKALDINPVYEWSLANLATVYHLRGEQEAFSHIEKTATDTNSRCGGFYHQHRRK